jgi:DNA-binding NtrC family response regulator
MHHRHNVRFRGTVPLPAELIGAAPSVQRAADVARRAADSDDSVLIVAEAGFCPERIARSIHQASPRSAEPFIIIDCADDHGAVLHRLFGTERQTRVDYEVARGGSALAEVGRGTLLLSDVSEMPAAAQLRISRLLRDGELRVRRTMAPVRFRVMASAAPSLEADVHQRRFRPELYRRLQRLRVDVPPLRDRAVDLPRSLTRR